MAKVLIVDDNQDMLETLEHLFSFYGFEVAKAMNGLEGIEAAKKEEPDIIILDALMPVMNGFEACEKLKQDPQTREIPIIFLSANYTEDRHRIAGLELGADDYILKPFNAKELITRVKKILKRKELVEQLRQDNKRLIDQQLSFLEELEKIKKRAKELEQNQIVDVLTGLYNENLFHKRLEEEFHRAKRYQNDLSLVLLDVDFFQKINEMYGDQTGDYILIKIANIILNNTRYSDVVFRLRGNLFAIILPNTDEAGAFYEAERIRTAIEQTNFFEEGFMELKNLNKRRKQQYQHITVSAGIASYTSELKDKETLIQNAREALTNAKSQRRNMTIRFSKIKGAAQE